MSDRRSKNAENDRAGLAAGAESHRTHHSIASDHRPAGRADRSEARELGAIDVLVKPIEWEKLLKLVAYAVQ